MLRLLGVPLFLWLLLGPEEDGWALVVLMVSGFTDWLDGKLARWLNQGSRLGRAARPGRRPALHRLPRWSPWRIRGVVPVWVVALLLGRELVLGVMLLVLRRYGYPPLQVHYLGKAATLLLLYAFPVLLIADGRGPAGRGSPQPFAWALTIWGTALYLLAGAVLRRPGRGHRAGRAGRPRRDVAVTATPARRRARARSGASLLDAVLAETLDPAYAQAAAARAARPGRRSGRGWRGRAAGGADDGDRRPAGGGHLRPGGRRGRRGASRCARR